jgi:hypothetical protein
MTWTAAKCFCEQMDMRLSSIETSEKLQCVANLQKSKLFNLFKNRCAIGHCFSDLTLQGTFWTSGYDLNRTGKYEWCTFRLKKGVTEFWGPGMPSNNSGECVKVTLQADGAPVLQNAKCSTTMSFICEVKLGHTHKNIALIL